MGEQDVRNVPNYFLLGRVSGRPTCVLMKRVNEEDIINALRGWWIEVESTLKKNKQREVEHESHETVEAIQQRTGQGYELVQ